jgi:hypothetical protein
VSKTEEFMISTPENLLSYMQLGIYEVVGEEMIVLKFFIDHE